MLFTWCLDWFRGGLLCYWFRVVGYCVGGVVPWRFGFGCLDWLLLGGCVVLVPGFVAWVMIACL